MYFQIQDCLDNGDAGADCSFASCVNVYYQNWMNIIGWPVPICSLMIQMSPHRPCLRSLFQTAKSLRYLQVQ